MVVDDLPVIGRRAAEHEGEARLLLHLLALGVLEREVVVAASRMSGRGEVTGTRNASVGPRPVLGGVSSNAAFVPVLCTSV